MNARMKFPVGESVGQIVEVAPGKFLIGRETDCHLRRETPFMSRHHCVLLLDDYTLRIRDLGSKNGTFVNGRRIGSGETILLDGDTVAVAEIIFEVGVDQSLPIGSALHAPPATESLHALAAAN
jgi:pSer/pThr/pTyr-binding forkhead associated (FHA) protein